MSIILEGLELLAHYRKEIGGYLKKIWHRVQHGEEIILVLGAGGVGKSTLGHLLAGAELEPGEIYEESVNIEHFSYQGKVFGSLIVAPGQQRRRGFHWPTLRKEIAQGKVLGVIYVVAHGLNSLREIEPSEHEVFKSGMSSADFMKAYIEFNLKHEIDILRDELMQSLKDAPGRIWFLTAVLKQDLWSKDEKEVLEHYQQGKYADLITEIQKARGDKDFVYECIPASLLIENLQTRRGVVLAETATGYDSAKQLESARDFLRVVSELSLDREVRGK